MNVKTEEPRKYKKKSMILEEHGDVEDTHKTTMFDCGEYECVFI